MQQKWLVKFPYVVANVLDFDILVSVFELQSRFYTYFRTNIFGKCMFPYLETMDQKVSLLLFNKDGFGIK